MTHYTRPVWTLERRVLGEQLRADGVPYAEMLRRLNAIPAPAQIASIRAMEARLCQFRREKRA